MARPYERLSSSPDTMFVGQSDTADSDYDFLQEVGNSPQESCSETGKITQSDDILGLIGAPSTPAPQRKQLTGTFDRLNSHGAHSVPRSNGSPFLSAKAIPSKHGPIPRSTRPQFRTPSKPLSRKRPDDVESMNEQSPYFTSNKYSKVSAEGIPSQKRFKLPRSLGRAQNNDTLKSSPITPVRTEETHLNSAHGLLLPAPTFAHEGTRRAARLHRRTNRASSSGQTTPPPPHPHSNLIDTTSPTPTDPSTSPPTAAEALFAAEVLEIKAILTAHTTHVLALCTSLHEKNLALERKVHVLETQTGHAGCEARLQEFVDGMNSRIDTGERVCRERWEGVVCEIEEMGNGKGERVPGGEYGGPKLEVQKKGVFHGLGGGWR